MNRCRAEGCTTPVLEGHAYCETHRLRWIPGKPVDPEPVSPWVRKALANRLPPKAAA